MMFSCHLLAFEKKKEKILKFSMTADLKENVVFGIFTLLQPNE